MQGAYSDRSLMKKENRSLNARYGMVVLGGQKEFSSSRFEVGCCL